MLRSWAHEEEIRLIYYMLPYVSWLDVLYEYVSGGSGTAGVVGRTGVEPPCLAVDVQASPGSSGSLRLHRVIGIFR